MLARVFGTLAVLGVASSLGACASIVSGSDQNVSVVTPDVQTANCRLSNDKGTWYVSSTPGSTMVKQAFGDMKVECEKDGFEKGASTVPSNVKGWIFGNILFGGLIGLAVDMITGAGAEYPTEMAVTMKKLPDPVVPQPTAATVPAAEEQVTKARIW